MECFFLINGIIYLFRFIVFVYKASEIIDQFACDMCMSGLVLYTEIIIRSGRPRHRGSARGGRL